jgi:hypothetical protein
VASSDQSRLCPIQRILPLSVNSVGGVIEHLVALDWFLEVTAPFWNVLSHDGSENRISSRYKIRAQVFLNQSKCRPEQDTMVIGNLPSDACELA